MVAFRILFLSMLAMAVASCRSGTASPQLVYVTNEAAGTIAIIDPARRAVLDTVPVGTRPRGMALSPDGRLLYVALSGSPIGGPWVDEDTLPPADKSKDGIAVFDTATRTVQRIIRGVSDPETVAVGPDGERLYVASEDTGQLVVLDAASGNVRATLAVGGEPEGVAVSPDGSLVYVTSEENHTVSVIDVAKNTVRAVIPVGQRPRNAVFSRDGRRAWVPGESDASVTAIDVARDRVIGRAVIAGETVLPMGIALAPDGAHLYLTTGRGGEVVRLDPQTLAVTARVKVGPRPWGVTVTNDGRWLISANGSSDDISVIDAPSMRMVGKVRTPGKPWGVITAT